MGRERLESLAAVGGWVCPGHGLHSCVASSKILSTPGQPGLTDGQWLRVQKDEELREVIGNVSGNQPCGPGPGKII